MKSLYLLLLFAAAIVANNSDHDNNQCPRKRRGCLGQNDVNYILNNWPRLFDTEDADWLTRNINCIVAEDFVSNNEGSMFFGSSIDPYLCIIFRYDACNTKAVLQALSTTASTSLRAPTSCATT
jgi:hypothetical protein